MSIEQAKGKGRKNAAPTFVLNEASAKAACKFPRLTDAQRRKARQEAWQSFGEALKQHCEREARIILDEVLHDNRNPLEVEALELSKRITLRCLYPDHLSPDESGDDVVDRARLQEIIGVTSHPDAVAARETHLANLSAELEAEAAERGLGEDWIISEDGQLMDDRGLYCEWVTMKYGLASFFKKALTFMADDPNGRKTLLAFGARKAGKGSGEKRGTPKGNFQEWARDVLKKAPGTSIGSLPEKYIRATGSTISILTLRKYLTPSGGFNPKG